MNSGLNSISTGRRAPGSAIQNPHSPASQNPSSDRHEQLTRAAGVLVSQTFFGQMLKQMRNDPFKSDLFDGGRGGQMFGSLLDQTLAQHMARGAGTKLVRSIVHHLERKGGDVKTRQANHADPSTGLRDKAPNPFQNVRIHVATDIRA